MKKLSTRKLVLCAAVAAVYTVMSFFGEAFGLTYGPIQCRFAEALCVLPFLVPETAWGLFLGCILTNLMSAYGPIDVVFGSLATLIAALCTARVKSRWLAPLPPVIANGVIVGAAISYAETGLTKAFWPAYVFNGLTVALGELLACYVLGMLLLTALPRIPFLRSLFGIEKTTPPAASV